ncbi:cysteine proteinase [Melanomma pulvis-pyrius CBS 109.77]|uniref:Cysteine proteinase n=1 Tax=Melanomma pulvis-pyrius CBS 109.77 TaxID=1314802 RepID=A0A6A6WQV8_9PLEO|nr:cysteine proteinase [Melanomma pulvis-pyrius CBS 109.77]
MSSVAEDDETKAPQQVLNEFWENLITKKPGKVTHIFPSSLYANLLPPHTKPGPAKGRNAAESYQVAADECRARVKRIIRECHRTNEKFTDPEFDIEGDLGTKNCLEGLMDWYNDPSPGKATVGPWQLSSALATLAESNLLTTPTMNVDLGAASRVLDYEEPNSSGGPGSVHRIDWIFETPSFTVDGYSSSDVQQGNNGDCWFIAAVATICSNPGLMDKICVEKDEECGIYGFVFYRDGEWIWTVVDDNLYLTEKDFDAWGDNYDPSGVKEKKYKKNRQTGSDALYFASCADQNETWLPLLEKAFAKVHGDYDSISGGISGEAVEDLTGGVTTKVLTNRILSKDRLWEELLEVNKQFLFSASSPGSYGDDSHARRGLALGHAYSIIKAVEEEDEEGKKHKLVLIRNPWGKRSITGVGEWNGAWSDGSKEWSPYWMKKLDYRFADDGIFWMSYDDLRKRFELLDRTRLFDKEWTVVQHWTSVSVAWVTGYLNTKFLVEIKKAGPTVFVLCQLDDRYFCGLEGQYRFDLHFLLQEENTPSGEHIVRARGAWFGNRSISAEVELQPGKYEVLPKIVASQESDSPEVQDVVKKLADRNPQKLRQIGMNYDIANAKGIVEISEEEKKKKEAKAKEAKEKKIKEKEEAEKEKSEFEQWKKEKKEREAKAGQTKEEDKPEPAASEEKAEVSESKPAAESSAEDKKATKAESESDSSDDDTEGTSSVVDLPNSKASAAPIQDKTEPASGAGPDGPPAYGASLDGPASVGGDAAPQPAANAPPAADNKQNPWNAVCVLGLRVYSKDPEVSIKLIKPTTAEEGAVLDADGATQAGATM